MRTIFYIVGFLLAGSSCKENKPAATKEEKQLTASEVQLTAAQMQVAGIQTGTFTEQPMEETIRLNGMIDVPPQNIVSVSFPLGGYLKSTRLLPGMHVSKGESIAIIEDQSLVQLQQDYLSAKSRMNLLKLDYERQRSLNESRTASDKILQQVQSDYETSRLQVLGLGEKLRLININPDHLSAEKLSRMVSIPSPINGFVSRVNVNIGKYVQPQDVLFELIDPSDIHAALTVFEKDINKLAEGQKVQVSFVDEPEKIHQADIILVTRNVDKDRSGVVHCHFEKMPANLKPGMYINATVTLSGRLRMTIPEEAVVRFGNQELIFVETGNLTFSATPVKMVNRFNGLAEISLPDSSIWQKTIVVKNAYAVLSKMKNTSEEE